MGLAVVERTMGDFWPGSSFLFPMNVNAPVRFCLLQGLEYHWVRAGSQGGFTIVNWEWGDGEMGRWGDGEMGRILTGAMGKMSVLPRGLFHQTITINKRSLLFLN